jgi:HAD superfamily hydrolase (TIGR01490 family)
MKAAFFDLDKTIIARASMVAYGRPLLREGLLSATALARAMIMQVAYLHFGAGEERMAKIREKVLEVAKGADKREVARLVRETLGDVIEPIIFAEALDLIESHRAAGHLVFIVSASPEEIVLPLVEYLGATGAIASRAVVDEEGRYTGELELYVFGPAKARAIRDVAEHSGVDLSESYAYSDSITDIPMLEEVGHPYAVNPDRALAKVAADRGWEVLHFTNPVRLRDHMPAPPGLQAAAVTGVALAAATGAALYAWRHGLRLRPAG